MEKNLIHRTLTSKIEQLSLKFPVITITGPRQSGKTTLCKELFPNYHYINLENIAIREQLKQDTLAYLNRYPEGIIIDEAHHYPDLFSYIQVFVDEHPDRKFILTGSSNFSLLQSITQSLAGRTAILTLLPLSLHELGKQVNHLSAETLILRGGYPAIWGKNIAPEDLYMNYYNTYVERDARQILHIKDITSFQKFIRLAAGRIGSECNNLAIAGEIGTSANTINAWFSILTASYITYMLPPYYENIGKRLVKTPKIYFHDTGLACFLLGIENEEQLKAHPLRGSLFENLVINEALKNLFNQGKPANLYFYRDSSQKEVDLVYTKANDFYTYEIKSAQTFHREFMKGLDYLKKLFQDRVQKSVLIYDGASDSDNIINFRNFNLDV